MTGAAASVDGLNPDLVEALQSVHRLVTHDPRDWTEDRHDAFLFGLFAGWDCHESHSHGLACADEMTAVATLHGWNAEFVGRLRRLERAVHRAIRGDAVIPTNT